MRASLTQSTEMPAGVAELRCVDSGIDPGSVEFRLSQPRAGGGLRHLDPGNAAQPWGAPEVWQRPAAAERDGTDLRLRLDAFTTFHLGANKPYILQLRDASGRRAETPLLGIALRLPSAPPKGWGEAAPAAVPTGAEPEAAPPTPPPEAVIPGPAADGPADLPRRRLPVVLAVVALAVLLAAAGAAWWLFGRTLPQEPPAADSGTVAPAPAPAAPARTLAAARAALAEAPAAAEARALGEAHLAAQDPQGAFLLLRHAAELGDAAAAVAVGALYDPATWSAENSPLPAPNAEQAAEWYRAAAEAGDAEAQYRLGMLLRSGATDAEDGPERAVAWLRRAAEQGHQKAQEAMDQ